MIANQIKMDLPFDSTRSYINQFATCSDADKGWLKRLEGMDFAWSSDQANLPSDDELVSAINNGTVLSFDNEYLSEFGERIQREVYDKYDM